MNLTKTLRSYTIIPPELYINRSADTQLQRTINDMGRPGYILVARQMGKTNLLLNAKSTLSNELDKFVYIDISNPFPDIRSFFKNIINTFFDSCPEINIETLELIEEHRKKTPSLPPHKEHENELRHIIRAIGGKLVICLDEIDALTRTNYSDEVFSFIRSIYFAGRANFSEFQQLTYVLSGVAEPSELIKNKAVSPFNIGEKIYLDDFSFSEFNTFIQKAKLTFDKEIIEHIYYWTNGNPRLSWDICAKLEDFILNNQSITIEMVDSTIADMYLKSFDLPPIDHIRTLVEEDRLVRDAIMAIHYEKSETISDAMRNRLYLSGITIPDQANNKKVKIRNRLLAESLSEKWIQDIEKQKTPIYELANKKYDAGKYEEALELYEEYIASTNNPEEPVLLYYNIGYCQFNLGHYQNAISNFEKNIIKKEEYPKLYYWVQHMLGFSHLYLGNISESSILFKKILNQDINSGKPLYLYFDSCLNLSTVLFYDFEKNQAEIRRLNNIVIDSEILVYQTSEEEGRANNLLTIAHYNLVKASKESGDFESARSSIKSAMQISDERTSPFLAIEASDITINKEEKIQILKLCVQNICNKKIAVAEKTKEYPLDFTIDICSRLIERLSENSINEVLDKLILHLENKDIGHNVNTGDVLFQAIHNALSKSNSKSAVKLITKYIYLPLEEESFEQRRYFFTIGIFITPFSEAKLLINKYWNEYIEPSDSKLIETDFRVIWGIIQGYLANNYFDIAKDKIFQIRNLMEKTYGEKLDELDNKQFTEGNILLDFLDLELDHRLGKSKNILEKAQDLFLQLKDIKTLALPYFAEDSLSQIRNKTQLIISLNSKPISTVRRDGKKYGQNEKIKVRFANERVEEGKYKYFKDKLDSGECQIIEN